jgi:hypothetical protein
MVLAVVVAGTQERHDLAIKVTALFIFRLSANKI